MEKEWKPNTFGLDFIEIFKARGISDKDMAMFVDPFEFANEKAPLLFHNMDRAVEMAKDAISNGDKILIVADVDTDGVTSGAMIYNTLNKYLNIDADIVIGKSKQHGLGQYEKEMFNAYDLVIACDSGSDEYDVYEYLKEQGIEVILLDHHRAEDETKSAIVVNPEMWPVDGSELSGAGVCLKFLQQLFKGDDAIEMPYDLAATGIIADMMDMRKEDNRKICATAFKHPTNKGILTLAGSYEFNSDTVSFSIAPLVNAAQRLGENELALKVFLYDTPEEEIKKTLTQLKQLKEKQKQLTDETLKQATIRESSKVVLGIANNDMQGLSGLVANKLSKDKQKPTIFVKQDGDLLRGSMRSYGVDNLKSLINKTKLAQADGHEGAAGFRVNASDLDTFLSVLEKELPDVLRQTIIVDAELDDLSELTFDSVSFIDKVNRVTGECFKPIRIMASGIKPDRVFLLSGKHTKISCGDVNLIMWNNTKPVDDWPKNKWKSFDIVGVPTIARYGSGIDVILDDIDYEMEE